MRYTFVGAMLVVAGCAPSPSPVVSAPPTPASTVPVVTVSAGKPMVRLPPPLLPVDCGAAAGDGKVDFCGQEVPVKARHVACHIRYQVDIGALACLPELRSVTLRGSGVVRLAPLRDLEHLARLSLGETRVSDLTPLAHLPRLEELGLDNTPVVDVTPLSGIASLRALRLRGCRGVNGSGLGSLRQLRDLSVEGTDFDDLSLLAEHRHLERVSLSPGIADLTPLETMPALRRLVIVWLHTRLGSSVPYQVSSSTRFRGVGNLPRLRELFIHDATWGEMNSLGSLASLGSLGSLEELSLRGTDIPFEAIGRLTTLKSLAIEVASPGLPLDHLRGLRGKVPDLERLELYNVLPDTPFLRGLGKLRRLTLSVDDPGRIDLGGLAGLPRLSRLELRVGTVKSLAPLRSVMSLRHVFLGADVEVPDREVAALRRARPDLVVDQEDDDDW